MNPTMEFEFFLAEKLGMTHSQLLATMGNDEFNRWAIYYQLRQQDQELAQARAEARAH